jgi:hypothetical protein
MDNQCNGRWKRVVAIAINLGIIIIRLTMIVTFGKVLATRLIRISKHYRGAFMSFIYRTSLMGLL